MDKEEMQLIAWILRGSQRREIIKALIGLKVPSQIYQEAVKLNPKITRNSVSDILRQFKAKELAKCINEEETKGRIYELTKLGRKIRDYVMKD